VGPAFVASWWVGAELNRRHSDFHSTTQGGNARKRFLSYLKSAFDKSSYMTIGKGQKSVNAVIENCLNLLRHG